MVSGSDGHCCATMQRVGIKPSLPCYFKSTLPPGLCPAAIPELKRMLTPAAPPFQPVICRMPVGTQPGAA